MRKLSAGIAIDPDTFAPMLVLMLDGVRTNTVFPMEAAADVKALHGSEAEQAFIDMAIDELSLKYKLTIEESEHYKANFQELMQDKVQLDFGE